MKTAAVHILLLLLALLVLSSDQCKTSADADRSQQEHLRATTHQVQRGLQSAHLPDSVLNDFEKQAQQKLLDYAEYLSLYLNVHLDSAFREVALSLMNQTFDDAQDTIRIQTQETPAPSRVPLYKIPDFSTDTTLSGIYLSIDSIEVAQGFSNTMADGKLAFTENWGLIRGMDTLPMYTTHTTCEMHLRRVSRQFGDSNLSSWKVFLGSME